MFTPSLPKPGPQATAETGGKMLHAQQVEELLCRVSRMDRATISRCLADIRSSFPIDLTPQFIETVNLDRLRHNFLAVCLQTKQMPAAGEMLQNVA